MGGQKFNKAYEAYQQAVYRDGRNPTFWCSIGVLYYQINQYRDALDAYSRAIRLNPYISEVWFDLGTLYESCNNQINDAIDAYARASDLDPTNQTIKSRLSLLRNAQRDGQPLPAPPPTQDVHPTAYGSTAAGGRQFHAPGGPGGHLPYESHAVDGMPVINGRDLAAPPPPQAAPLPASAFRGGGGPPPLQLDDMRNPAAHNTPLAPMTVDRNPGNDSAMNRGGPQGHMNNAEERRRAPLSPPPAGRHRGEPARGPQGGSADWDPRRRDVWEDREPAGRRGSRSDKFSGPGPSYRTSPAPSLNRGSPVIPPARQAWDPRHEALGHGGRTPAHEAIDRRVSGGSDNRGPGHMNGQVFDRRMEMEQPPRSRPGSPPRYAPDSRETERYRNDERSWREHDARLREEAEKRARPGARDHFLPESRPLAGSMRSPASVHVAPQAESAKKKRKSRGASPERVSPRGSTSSKDKKPTNESLGSPPSARVLDDVERRSPFAGSRAASPSAPKVAASPIRAAPVPRQSGRIIDEGMYLVIP
jgi:glucose repression mediator protein